MSCVLYHNKYREAQGTSQSLSGAPGRGGPNTQIPHPSASLVLEARAPHDSPVHPPVPALLFLLMLQVNTDRRTEVLSRKAGLWLLPEWSCPSLERGTITF